MSALDAGFVRRQFALLQLEQAATSVLQNAMADDASVVALALAVESDGECLVLRGEFHDARGLAVGGFGL